MNRHEHAMFKHGSNLISVVLNSKLTNLYVKTNLNDKVSTNRKNTTSNNFNNDLFLRAIDVN